MANDGGKRRHSPQTRTLPSATPRHVKRKKTRRREEPPRDDLGQLGKSYLREAYNVLSHINTLTRMLSSIRKPYLNVETREPLLSQRVARNIDLDGGKDAWANIRYLTNEERDQIDIQARVIFSRCADRIKEMEALEKRRAELISRKNPLARFIPLSILQGEETASSDFIAAHHSSMTWFLSRRLTEASQAQKEMQEERVKRQLERTRTLGSSAGYEMLRVGSKEAEPTTIPAKSESGGWLGGASSTIFSAIGQQTSHAATSTANVETVQSDEEDEDIELTASQIMQFETENANILKSVQDTLESIQQAESRLMDISALQMELVSHLTRQTELTDQLFEDAIATSSTVEKGNVQLREAKRRAKDSRLFILLFLIGASLSLLFLHYY
ncbi:snare protein syntaxin 18/UFE1 [Amanita rubescens]|nr:snare protein syntaxin 18/UFE1 [Amanita rubescens]